MTDEQIEKVLELCANSTGENCWSCPYPDDSGDHLRYNHCQERVMKDALGYIKRLKEKNQQLEQEIEKLRGGEIK